MLLLVPQLVVWQNCVCLPVSRVCKLLQLRRWCLHTMFAVELLPPMRYLLPGLWGQLHLVQQREGVLQRFVLLEFSVLLARQPARMAKETQHGSLR